MASKENQEALEVVKSYLRTDNAYVTTVTGEAVKALQQAIDNEELYKSLLNSPDTKPNNDDDIVECICFVREIHTKKVMLEVCDWCYGEWDIANNFELLGWTLARKELENGK